MNKKNRTILLRLVRQAIQASLSNASDPSLEKPGSELLVESGAFVTLHSKADHSLRGCIGNLTSSEVLPDLIVKLAKDAAFEDPRFPPVTIDELDNLCIEISLLTPMHNIEKPEQIRLGIDGVLLTYGYHRAVFLPQVATEQQWNLEQMLAHLCSKAGLWPTAWKERGCNLQVFQAEVFSEKTCS